MYYYTGMLSKSNRLTKRGSFRYLYRNGTRKRERKLSLTYVCTKGNVRAGFTVSNKVGKAVRRNKLKRRMRAAFRTLMPNVKRAQMVFTASPDAVDMEYAAVRAEMEKLLRASGLYETKKTENSD